jgi:hypothetical protein
MKRAFRYLMTDKAKKMIERRRDPEVIASFRDRREQNYKNPQEHYRHPDGPNLPRLPPKPRRYINRGVILSFIHDYPSTTIRHPMKKIELT